MLNCGYVGHFDFAGIVVYWYYKNMMPYDFYMTKISLFQNGLRYKHLSYGADYGNIATSLLAHMEAKRDNC